MSVYREYELDDDNKNGMKEYKVRVVVNDRRLFTEIRQAVEMAVTRYELFGEGKMREDD